MTGLLRVIGKLTPNFGGSRRKPRAAPAAIRHRAVSRRRARAALFWLFGLMAVSHIAFWFGLEFRFHELRDPEYGRRQRSLQRLTPAQPGRPVVLVFGSSRVVMGLRPGLLDQGDESPLVFNAARIGGGPLAATIMLRRYLAGGVRPAAVVVEVWPQLFNGSELDRIEAHRLRLSDLVCLRHHPDELPRVRRAALAATFAPWADYRYELTQPLLPGWTPAADRVRRQTTGWTWDHLDAWGWKPLDQRILSGLSRSEVMERMRARYGPPLQDLPFHAAVEKDYRSLLMLCREHAIPAALVYLPESSEFRTFYGPATWLRFQGVLGRLRDDFGVALIDGRCVVDDLALPDGHHLTPEGAAGFTHWFEAHGLRPWLRSRPPRGE